MKIKILLGMFFSLAAMSLSGCGGGGGGGAAPAPTTPTVVSGTPFKGPFDGTKDSVVNIFGVDANNIKGTTPLKTTKLDAFGAYSVDISPYTGPIVVEVTGTYKDEATGLPVIIKPTDPPLRAIIADAKGNVQANVTPLTELAAKKVGGVLTKSTIDIMNANIAALFKVDDIFNTKPVDATAAASATASAAEKNQSLVLAALSQLVKNTPGKSLDQVLVDMTADITVNQTTPASVTMADKSTAGFKTAMIDFVTNPTLNKTNVTIASAPSVGNLKLAHLKISAVIPATAPAGVKIGGVDFSFDLPAGVTLSKVSNSSQVSPGQVVVSGGAAATGTTSISLATLNLQTLRTLLASDLGFGAVEFVDVSCTIPTGSTVTATSFPTTITPTSVTDLAGTPVTGVTLSVSTEIF